MRKLSAAALLAVCALAQTGAPQKGVFEDHPAWTLANDKLSLTILAQGATLADLVLTGDPSKMSPLWNAFRLARESGGKNEFGFSTGHFVCVDGFGPASKEEQAAGLQGHGEAHRQTFQLQASSKQGHVTSITLSANLPIVQEQFTRTFRAVDGENVIYVESQLENLLAFDRPVNWAEHATVGSPFLESGETVVDISGSRSKTRPYTSKNNGALQRRLTSGEDFTWPMAPGLDGKKIDLRLTPQDPHYLDHSATLLDPARKYEWVTALNPVKKLIFGYVFKREEYPWIQYWGNYPASRKMSRGLEFGTQPFDVSRREAISTGSMFGVPTYRWLPAKSKIESRFLLFFAHAPDGFAKVDDVRLENGRIVIEDHTAKKQITLNASQTL